MYKVIAGRDTELMDQELLRRRQANRDYMMRLLPENLLRHHAGEAGEVNDTGPLAGIHGGWESPLCQLRGHFVGHWLSAAALHYEATGDEEILARAERMVQELGRYQALNGDGWAAPIPTKYLDWIASGRKVWAPQYTIHKTLMGLVDLYRLGGSQKALEVALAFAGWFHRWSGGFDQEQWEDILDFETGGMLEVWVDLYAATGEDYLWELVRRYDRRRLFEPLLAGQDVLTNQHANTTIPEVLGAARAYEVSGDERWMNIVRAYWEQAVEKRGTYCTGGATAGEVWGPPMELSARLGEKTQEHCTVYNMMRLADFLFRHTGESRYADYWEKNLYNGIMAQGYWEGSFTHGNTSAFPTTGLLSYFLPLKAGGRKAWSSETQDFFCCHGTLVQANAAHNSGIYYQSEAGLAVCQYLDSRTVAQIQGAQVRLSQRIDRLVGEGAGSSVRSQSQRLGGQSSAYFHNPQMLATVLEIQADKKTRFALRLRLPDWCRQGFQLWLDGEKVNLQPDAKGFLVLEREWENSRLVYHMKRDLWCWPMPDVPDMVAFMDGPVVLAGLCEQERALYTQGKRPQDLLAPDNEREWSVWQNTYKINGQDQGLSFIPLYQVGYQPYTVYFPLKK